MSIDRPSIRARGTTEFRGGPYDGLVLVCAHYEKMPLVIEVVFLKNGQHMMRRLLIEGDEGQTSGFYRLAPESEAGSGNYHWQYV